MDEETEKGAGFAFEAAASLLGEAHEAVMGAPVIPGMPCERAGAGASPRVASAQYALHRRPGEKARMIGEADAMLEILGYGSNER